MKKLAVLAALVVAVLAALFVARKAKAATATMTGITLDQLQAAMPSLPDDKAALYLPLLNAAMSEADISTPARQTFFLAELAHESNDLQWWQEFASGAAYEGRPDLGNVDPGDGMRFKGRGPIQLTGRKNYQDAGDALGLDLVEDPELVLTPEVGFRTSAWYWVTHDINALADAGDFDAATRAINGGLNGIDDRRRRLALAQGALGVEAAA